MRNVSQPDLPKVDVEPSVAIVEESSPADDAAVELVKEEPVRVSPVPPLTLVQVQVSLQW